MSPGALSRVRLIAAALVLLAWGALLASSAQAQSLADVARKEEDRRKSTPSPARVYTNKDLNAAPAGSPPSAVPAAPAPGADSSAAKAAGADATKGGKTPGATAGVRDQAFWANRLKALQDTLARDENYADAMQTRINALTTDAVNRDDPAQRAVIEKNRQKSLAELASLTKSVADTKKAIADLYEEARRAGVPPGWLR